jgi:hypothetical protein
METVLFAWVDLITKAIEVAALGAVLCQLFQLRPDIMAILRVLRFIDRRAETPRQVA